MADDANLAQLAGRLRELRADTGLTLRELSRKVHVSDSSLSRYFAAQALPPWDVVEALANLAGAERDELRRCWESVVETRKRARWSQPNDSDGEPRPIPLWEPELPQQVPAATVGRGRRAGLVAGVVVLVAAAYAAGWSWHSQDHLAVPVPVPVTERPAGTLAPTPSGEAPAPTGPATGPTTNNPPVALPRATPSPTISPVRVPPTPTPTASRKPTPAPPLPRSGTVVALTNNDSGIGSVPYVIDVTGWSMDDHAPVQLYNRRTDGDYRNQLWTAETMTSGKWRFVDVYSGKCLYRDTGGSVFQSTCAGDAAQQWSFGPGGELRSPVDGHCLEIAGHQRLIGAALRMTACDGGWYQLWHTEPRPLT